ncbi:asparagine synthase (glutamine-hydrolyzing) [Temperatibacter marinus]|uniref:asparagine synthase (glutamine-hydrolyzing) n=1 Tax=Temperatibacter marinus TaxID=1456591 RepID=A0AA52EHH0_9PROT|nr:asparagine synthase (glutamine-hydrolyzing) [Temperatibacter marinus]WND02599.1 asparagine synthase (glutamine-hydrolyzing) [Temperatibacter marinus]
MCGIAGLFSVSGKQEFLPVNLNSMMDPMQHRGPDGTGQFIDRGIALGHLRLSIVDLEGGVQPMHASRGAAILTFNGEIYNAAELRETLEAEGYTFQTSHSDTEVLLNAYLYWGDDCVTHFRGMFSFAIWDAMRQQLFIARDRLGIKPLYYTQVGDVFAFASELKGLLAIPDLCREINPEAIEDFLTLGYIPDPKTIFLNSYKLPPGHSLTYSRRAKGPVIRKYWDLNFMVEQDPGDLQKELVDRLREAVDIRMISDVPLGAFLSGGVDSSLVVSLMATSSDQAINTCSIGIDDVEMDESGYADKVAKIFNTKHSMRLADPARWLDLKLLARVYDEPFADNSAIPMLKVSAAARENVTVSLSGDGGDEVFFGYRRQYLHMQEHKLRKLIPENIRRNLFGFLGRYYPKFDYLPRFLRAKSTFEALAMTDAEAYCHTVSKTPSRVMNILRSDKLERDLGGYRTRDLFKGLYAEAPADTEMARIKYIDFKTYLAGGVLTKVDRASMHHSLEVRVPILDHKFVEWAATVPETEQLQGTNGKACLKKALEEFVDKDIIYREKKGFNVPVGDWMNNELLTKLQSLSKSPALKETGYLNTDSIDKMVKEHTSGMQNHEGTLWALIMLDESLSYLLGKDAA